MNSLKNLLIIAVLAAVGYGVYASLQRNNADPGQPPGVAEGWPTVPKVEMPSAKTLVPLGGPLALGGSATRPAGGMTNGGGGTAPPFTPPSVASVAGSSPGTVSAMPPSSPVGPATGISPPAGMSPPGDVVRNLSPPPDATATSSAAQRAASPTDSRLQNEFTAFMAKVQKTLDEDKLAEAHSALSMLYGNPDLPAEAATQITDLLDQLAGTVIYSRRHYLERPYVTQQGETIEKIAEKYNVPWELLANINGLTPAAGSYTEGLKDYPLPAGMELKVVRGPFEAVVHLDRHELTLVLQGRYAGRFAIGVGRDQPSLEGNYSVREKAMSPTYYGPDGVNISPNDPRNPLGRAWIGLTDRIGIHGVNDAQCVGRNDNRGTIGVGDRDLQDLYGILSVGSRVTVLR